MLGLFTLLWTHSSRASAAQQEQETYEELDLGDSSDTSSQHELSLTRAQADAASAGDSHAIPSDAAAQLGQNADSDANTESDEEELVTPLLATIASSGDEYGIMTIADYESNPIKDKATLTEAVESAADNATGQTWHLDLASDTTFFLGTSSAGWTIEANIVLDSTLTLYNGYSSATDIFNGSLSSAEGVNFVLNWSGENRTQNLTFNGDLSGFNGDIISELGTLNMVLGSGAKSSAGAIKQVGNGVLNLTVNGQTMSNTEINVHDLTLSADTTFNGKVTVANTVSGEGNILLGDGAHLTLNINGSVIYASKIKLAEGAGSAWVDLTGTNTTTSDVTFGEGVNVRFDKAADSAVAANVWFQGCSLNVLGDVDITGGTYVKVTGAGNITIDGQLSGEGSLVEWSDGGKITLKGGGSIGELNFTYGNGAGSVELGGDLVVGSITGTTAHKIVKTTDAPEHVHLLWGYEGDVDLHSLEDVKSKYTTTKDDGSITDVVSGTDADIGTDIGYGIATSGTMTLNTAGTLDRDFKFQGLDGTGTMTVTGGAQTFGKYLTLEDATVELGESGTLSITGGLILQGSNRLKLTTAASGTDTPYLTLGDAGTFSLMGDEDGRLEVEIDASLLPGEGSLKFANRWDESWNSLVSFTLTGDTADQYGKLSISTDGTITWGGVVTYTWSGSGALTWDEAIEDQGSWDKQGTMTEADHVVFEASGEANITVDTSGVHIGTMTVKGTNQQNFSGGDLQTTYNLVVESGASASFSNNVTVKKALKMGGGTATFEAGTASFGSVTGTGNLTFGNGATVSGAMEGTDDTGLNVTLGGNLTVGSLSGTLKFSAQEPLADSPHWVQSEVGESLDVTKVTFGAGTGLEKTGDGKLTVTAGSETTWEGSLKVSEGEVSLGNSAKLTIDGDVEVGDGALLNIDGSGKDLTVKGDFTFKAGDSLNASSNSNTTGLNLNNGAFLTVEGDFNGSGKLGVYGTLTLKKGGTLAGVLRSGWGSEIMLGADLIVDGMENGGGAEERGYRKFTRLADVSDTVYILENVDESKPMDAAEFVTAFDTNATYTSVGYGKTGTGKLTINGSGNVTFGNENGFKFDEGIVQFDGGDYGMELTIKGAVTGAGTIYVATTYSATGLVLEKGGSMTGVVALSQWGGHVTLGDDLEIGGLSDDATMQGNNGKFAASDGRTRGIGVQENESHKLVLNVADRESYIIDKVTVDAGVTIEKKGAGTQQFDQVTIKGAVEACWTLLRPGRTQAQ